VHVAFFNRAFHPEGSATAQLLTDLCEDLVARHGCRVSVVAGVPLAAGVAGVRRGVLWCERLNGVEILRARGTRFSKRRFAGRFANYVSYFLAACWAGQRLARPDVVVAQTDPPIIGLAAYLAARRFRAPFVMAYKDVFPEVARLLEDFRSAAVERALEAVNRFLVRKADLVLALGETMRRRLVEGKGAPPERTRVIADWADCSAIVPGPKRNAFSEAHGLADRFVVMHSGNVGLSQNLEALVEAAARLRAVPDLEVVIVGEGVKKTALQALAARLGLANVRFLPYQPKERLVESFAAADVFVVSLLPGLAGYIVPSKLYGILAAGRPYVAAVEEECEVTAITRRFECGLLAEPGKADALAEGILTFYHDRALAARLGANARRAALEFDRPRQVAAYHEAYQALVGSRGRGFGRP